MPALVHDGALVTESAAICLYLTDLYPETGIGPRIGDPSRGPYLSWLAYNAGNYPVRVRVATWQSRHICCGGARRSPGWADV